MRCAAKGLDGEVRHMPQSTRTAEEAAAACGCAVGQIVKSLVFRGAKSGKPYLLLVSGANRVNEKAVAARIGEPLHAARCPVRARRDRALPSAAFRRSATTRPLATYMDEALLAFDVVWAAAGTPDAVFPVAPAHLAAGSRRPRHRRRLSAISSRACAACSGTAPGCRNSRRSRVAGRHRRTRSISLSAAQRLERLVALGEQRQPSRSTARSCRRRRRRR